MLTTIANHAALTYLRLHPSKEINLETYEEEKVAEKVGKPLGLVHVGTGATRMVLRDPVHGLMVYKFAHESFSLGAVSNKKEWETFQKVEEQDRPRFAAVLGHSANFEVLLQDNVEGFTLSEVLRADKITTEQYHDILNEAVSLGRKYFVNDVNSTNVMIKEDGSWVIVDYAGF